MSSRSSSLMLARRAQSQRPGSTIDRSSGDRRQLASKAAGKETARARTVSGHNNRLCNRPVARNPDGRRSPAVSLARHPQCGRQEVEDDDNPLQSCPDRPVTLDTTRRAQHQCVRAHRRQIGASADIASPTGPSQMQRRKSVPRHARHRPRLFKNGFDPKLLTNWCSQA